MWEATVKPEPPYDFNQVLSRLTLDPLAQVNVEAQTVAVPLVIDEEADVVMIKGIGDAEHPEFQVSGNTLPKEKALPRLEKIFQWDKALQPIYDHFQNTNLDRLFTRFRGTPLVRDFDLYGCLMKCIIHQQLNLSFAFTLSSRFKQAYGYEKNGVWFYPHPEVIARLPYEELQAMQFSRRKAEYVIDVSRKVAEGTLNLNALEQMTDEEVVRSLTSYRGIGPWTAENMLLFGLGRQNLLPKADIGIQNALKLYFNLDKKPTIQQMEELSKNWQPYASFASLYLWRSIET